MRKNIFLLFMIGVIAASCGDAKKDKDSSLNDKKAELQKLKQEDKKLNDKIAALEADIAKLDPDANTGSAKLVTVAPLSLQDFSHYIQLQGKVDATNISYVAPANGQGGVVTALYVTQGQSVHKGQLLAKLDDQMIRQQIEPLRVQLASAEDTYKRSKNLFDQGIGVYQNVLNAKTQMESLQKQIGIIERQSSLFVVTAPSSGVIDALNLRVGEMMSPAPNIVAPQIRIVNTSTLKVTAAVPENYLSRVKVGSKLEVHLPEESNKVINATVNVVQSIIDPVTRTFTIEAKIPSDVRLKPNQVAEIKILDYTAPSTIVVPLNVVQSDEKGKYVYVMEKKGDKAIATRKVVSVGESFGNGIEIKSGLSAGEQLITEGYQNLYEGQVVATELKS